MAYATKVIKRTGFLPGAENAIRDYWSGTVVWKGEKVEHVADTGWYPLTDAGHAQALKAAERLAKRYERYRKHYGKRYEVIEREKAAKKAAQRKAERELRHRQERAAPKLIDAVEYLIAEIEGFKVDNDFITRRVEAVKAILQEIETPPAPKPAEKVTT